jgi:hypothetical protein
MQITFVVDGSDGELKKSAADRQRYARLIEDLGRYTRIGVEVVENLRRAPPEGFILLPSRVPLSSSLDACDENVRAGLPKRLILLGVSWQKALEQLEKYKLAGLVDSLRFAEWMAGSPPRFGPYGRRELLRETGAVCASFSSLGSEHYCLLQSDERQHPGGLPQMLAGYLRAYEQAGMMNEVQNGVYVAG